MVDNQHKKISGYRDLSEAEIALMNEAKALEKSCLEFLNTLDKLHQDEAFHFDKRWLAIGRTHVEQGFMAIVRSIAKPNT